MKKLLSLLLALALPLLAFSQEETHMMFQGIPIDGSVPSFVQKMENKGWTYSRTTNDIIILTGHFASNNAELYIAQTYSSHQVWKVSVFFDEETNWYALKTIYNHFKEMLSTKYGDPSSSCESFDDPYYEGDGYELSATRNDKCHYMTIWDKDNGLIGVVISDACVYICYEDAINRQKNNLEKNKQAAYQDL
mgnify:CR=1 FL=1|jgi:hypothetical protein